MNDYLLLKNVIPNLALIKVTENRNQNTM